MIHIIMFLFYFIKKNCYFYTRLPAGIYRVVNTNLPLRQFPSCHPSWREFCNLIFKVYSSHSNNIHLISRIVQSSETKKKLLEKTKQIKLKYFHFIYIFESQQSIYTLLSIRLGIFQDVKCANKKKPMSKFCFQIFWLRYPNVVEFFYLNANNSEIKRTYQFTVGICWNLCKFNDLNCIKSWYFSKNYS